MKTLFLIIINLLILGFSSKSQSLQPTIVTTSGAYFSNDDFGNLHWTLGEPASETFENQINLTQGFQQYYLQITSVFEAEALPFSVEVFPNPTTEILNIKNKESNEFRAVLSDATGRQIKSLKIIGESEQLDLGELPEGMYFLSAFREGLLLKTFKIMKVSTP